MWALLGSRKETGEKDKDEKAVAAPSRVATQAGQVVVILQPEEQEKNGIRASSLELVSRKQELTATAVILPAHELINLRNSYVSATAEMEKARASLNVSRREYERLSALYKDEQNASPKAVQAAEGTMQGDQATLKAAEDSLALAQNNVRQQWGEAIGRWLLAASPEFERIVRQQDLLVQVTLPPGVQVGAPPTASLQSPQGKLLKARLISPFPRLDPRIQSPSFLYLTRSEAGIVPGLNLAVLLPAGPMLQGITVAPSAVVWWEGRAWAYVQTSPTQFSRREVPTHSPVNEGWFVPISDRPDAMFKPGERIVINGAQQLLSEEFRSETQTIGEKD